MPANIDELLTTISTLKLLYCSSDLSDDDLPNDIKGMLYFSYFQTVLTSTEVILSNFNSMSEDVLITRLEKFLAKHWDIIKGTALSYTALPESDITKLLCDIGELVVASKIKAGENCNIVSVLMPTIITESAFDPYPDLSAPLNISTLIKTHILSDESQHLIPIHLLTMLDKTKPVQDSNISMQTQLENPYYDYKQHADNHHLSNEEYQRLAIHSPLTQAIAAAHSNYLAHANDTSNLLGHLRQLSSQLRINSVNELGQETNAGIGAYAAIINFMNYYQSIGDDQIAKIPVKVRQQIDRIRTLSSDPTVNISATATIDTCLSLRRDKLEDAMLNQEAALSAVSLSSANNTLLINESIQQFDEAVVVLKQAIDTQSIATTYHGGHDALPFKKELLDALGFKIIISSMEDLQDFMGFSPAEISEFSKEVPMQRGIIDAIPSIDDLVVLITETSPERLKSLFKEVGSKIHEKLIKHSWDITALLTTLNEERIRLICEILKDKLTGQIKSGSAFGSVFQYLSNEQCASAFEIFQDKLPAMIQSSNAFASAMRVLSAVQRTLLIKAFKHGLPDLIQSKDDFSLLCAQRSTSDYALILDLVKHKLPNIIKSFDDLYQVHENIPKRHKKEFFGLVKHSLASRIKSATDLGEALEKLTTAQSVELCDELENNIPDLIKSADDFETVIKHLLQDDNDHAPRNLFGPTPRESRQIRFAPLQRQIFFDVIKNSLPSLINSSADFEKILTHLSVEQYKTTFVLVKTKLDRIIKSPGDFLKIFRYITSGQDFATAHRYLSEEQFSVIYNKIKSQLYLIICSGEDFVSVLECLSPKHHEETCLAVENMLPDLLQSSVVFGQVLALLDIELYPMMCEALQEQLTGMQADDDFLQETYMYLSKEKRQALNIALDIPQENEKEDEDDVGNNEDEDEDKNENENENENEKHADRHKKTRIANNQSASNLSVKNSSDEMARELTRTARFFDQKIKQPPQETMTETMQNTKKH